MPAVKQLSANFIGSRYGAAGVTGNGVGTCHRRPRRAQEHLAQVFPRRSFRCTPALRVAATPRPRHPNPPPPPWQDGSDLPFQVDSAYMKLTHGVARALHAHRRSMTLPGPSSEAPCVQRLRCNICGVEARSIRRHWLDGERVQLDGETETTSLDVGL